MFSLDELAVAFLGHLFVFSCVVERNIRLLLFFSCSGERERHISISELLLFFWGSSCFNEVADQAHRKKVELLSRRK